MEAEAKLWLTAVTLGVLVGIARLLSDEQRAKRQATVPARNWVDRSASLILSATAGIVCTLYLWEPLIERRTIMLCWGAVAAWYGPDYPRISAAVFNRWIARRLLNGNNGPKDS
jgi:hypothetical protein